MLYHFVKSKLSIDLTLYLLITENHIKTIQNFLEMRTFSEWFETRLMLEIFYLNISGGHARIVIDVKYLKMKVENNVSLI